MRRTLFLSVIASTCYVFVAAQSKLKFENNNQVGLLAGSSGTSWQWQTVNGVGYKTYCFGIGVGVDHYYFKTIPVFVDLRKNIFEKRQTPFVYLDMGSNFPVKKNESSTWQTTSYNDGFYYDFGVGYKWPLGKRFNLNSSFGYSQKKYSTREEYHWAGGMDPSNYPDRYDYRLQRFSIKFGLGF